MIALFSKASCWRLVAVRAPGVDIFQGLSDFGEWEDLYEIEGLTNERTRIPVGNLSFIPKDRRAYGPGSAYIMAPFAYCAPGRFGDGSYGVLYAALEEATAMAEVAFHRGLFLGATRNPKESADFQVLTLKFTGELEDLRPAARSALVDPDPSRYGPCQLFGAQVRCSGGDGIVYRSVRRLGGECVAGFRPDRFSDCRHARLVQFYWDGERVIGPEGSYTR